MIAEIGHFCLILALVTALLQATLPLYGAQKEQTAYMGFADKAARIQFALLAASFICLTYSFLASDFSVKLAATHSHTTKPFLYKISGVWGNHEGSILLWTVMLGLYGFLFSLFSKPLPANLRARTLAVQALLGVGFISFVLFTSNPFERLFPAPLDGLGLNPILQDPGLAIHPPLLYLGYVGYSLAFSMAVAALMSGEIGAAWAKALKPWSLLAWSFLTLGITMGSIWAYYELGWGGWWMWDPVENVSFMPWLIGTALLHSIMVMERKQNLAHWTVLLAITAFSLSLVGTFIVRSGVLVSVHAFAVDPARGVFILALLLLATGGALGLYAFRAKTLMRRAEFDQMSREGGLVLNNLLLATATATVFLGTFYPLLMDAFTGDKISVGKPYFDLTFAPIMCVLILFMGAAPLLKWQRDSLASLKKFGLICGVGAIAITGLTFLFGKSVLGGLGLALAAYLAFGAMKAFLRKRPLSKLPKQARYHHLSFALAHLGVAVFTAGAVIMSVWADDTIGRVKPGGSLDVAGYSFTLTDINGGETRNYTYRRGEVSLSKNGRDLKTLRTEQRFYPVREMITTEAGFNFGLGATLFAAIGEGTPEDGYILRANYQPAVIWIWIGALMMALAGFLSLIGIRTLSHSSSRPDQLEKREAL
ncbi:heme lyase CcmF/NrfE family subunit [Litorimonas sp.]|uniref:heme lyase CcmF/NrfE family subunit n=1 Tax=Litorimonas sp. TaxID=1892381 RepID=UPI003A85DF5B